jgi:hypothetical protein
VEERRAVTCTVAMKRPSFDVGVSPGRGGPAHPAARRAGLSGLRFGGEPCAVRDDELDAIAGAEFVREPGDVDLPVPGVMDRRRPISVLVSPSATVTMPRPWAVAAGADPDPPPGTGRGH